MLKTQGRLSCHSYFYICYDANIILTCIHFWVSCMFNMYNFHPFFNAICFPTCFMMHSFFNIFDVLWSKMVSFILLPDFFLVYYLDLLCSAGEDMRFVNLIAFYPKKTEIFCISSFISRMGTVKENIIFNLVRVSC